MTINNYQKQIEQIEAASHSGQALNLIGGDSKAFYAQSPSGAPLYTNDMQGIIEYDPAELVMVASAGTPLADIQAALAEEGQMLGFEPPFSAQGATLGGVVASGLAGSARPYRGGVRDYLLGAKLVNGKAETLQFGGRVMKNVAGFDLFRPMAGAMGTLGLLLELSLRVIPRPEAELSLTFALDSRADAIRLLCELGKSLACLSAAAWFDGSMIIRLSGSMLAIKRDRGLLAPRFELHEADHAIWVRLGEFKHDIFSNSDDHNAVVAIDLPPAARDIELPGAQLIDWGGARRYLRTPLALESIRSAMSPVGGSVSLIHRVERKQYFQPLSPGLMAVHKRLKASFDPKGIFNPGRLFPGL